MEKEISLLTTTTFVGLLEHQSNYNGTAALSQVENLPMYLRISVGILVTIILIVGIIGNAMVSLVIISSRDMRTSTNFFLVNLSIADLLVLVVVIPTALLEVIEHPEAWLLGPTMCKVVPMLESLVCHASVLIILAISFERYYAICSPLKVLYVCTRARAVFICIFVWIISFIVTSPMLVMTEYHEVLANGEWQSKCLVGAGKLWQDVYTVSTMIIFFLLPFIILLIIYGKIVAKLTMDRSDLNAKTEHQQAARIQVVLMLGTVVFTFFLCLLPFRLLTLFVLLTDSESYISPHSESWYNIMYFCRLMVYINSALNPILYNIMSTKFRNGFKRLCGQSVGPFVLHRNGTFLTLTTPGNTVNNNLANSTSTSPVLSGSFVKRNGTVKRLEGGNSFYKCNHGNKVRNESNFQEIVVHLNDEKIQGSYFGERNGHCESVL